MTTSSTLPNPGATGTNPLKALNDYGQSPWMDYIRRDLLTSGDLKRMIDEDGLRGHDLEPRHFRKGHHRRHRTIPTSRTRPTPRSSTPRASTKRSPFGTCRTPPTSSRRL